MVYLRETSADKFDEKQVINIYEIYFFHPSLCRNYWRFILVYPFCADTMHKNPTVHNPWGLSHRTRYQIVKSTILPNVQPFMFLEIEMGLISHLPFVLIRVVLLRFSDRSRMNHESRFLLSILYSEGYHR